MSESMPVFLIGTDQEGNQVAIDLVKVHYLKASPIPKKLLKDGSHAFGTLVCFGPGDFVLLQDDFDTIQRAMNKVLEQVPV